MAYKSKGGCTPITAKIQKTTKGGMVTQPILNMGAPVKMKMSSPAKQNDGPFGAAYQKRMAEKRLEKEKASAQKDMAKYKEGLSQYKKDTESIKSIPEYNRGPIEGRMSRFEKQYGARMRGEAGREADDLARKNKTGRYAKVSKAKKIKSDAKPKREKVEAVKSVGIKPVSVETKLTGKVDTAIIKPKVKKVEPTKKQARKTKSIDKKLTKAKAARDAGNIRKAERKERAASRKAARIARRTAK